MQAITVSKLCECHATILLGASERNDLVFAIISFHTTSEGVQWNKIHHLREIQFAVVHDNWLSKLVSFTAGRGVYETA